MTRNKVDIPEDVVCTDCGSNELRGAGEDFRKNPNGTNPKRYPVQRYKCKKCGLIFIDGTRIRTVNPDGKVMLIKIIVEE